MAERQSGAVKEELKVLFREPTAEVLEKRKRAYEEFVRFRETNPLTPGPFPSAEEMVREDRER